MGVYIPYKRLPSAYQEVEYIESSGTQYIDTGIKPTNNTKIVSKLYMTSGAYQILCGVGRAGYYQSVSIYIDGTNYNYIGRWRSSSSGNSTVSSSVIATGTTPHIFESSQSGGFYIDGTKIGTFTSYSFTESYNMYLFGWNNYGSARDLSSGAIYYFKIYENGTLVRDFVPCYRIADGVIGLYDLVNNQFYTNSGTGTFSKGNDVTMSELKNAYIGEVYEYSYDFRGKSSTILTNDGWDIFYNPSKLKFNSYGIIPTTTDTSVMLKIVKSGICSNAKKVTLSITGTLISGEGYRLSLFNTATSSTRSGISGPFFNTVNTQTTIYGTNVTTSETNSGQITTTTIFDLDNGTWSTTQTDGYSNSGTLTSTQISNIKNNSNGFYVSVGSSGSTPQGGISKISIIVE